MEVDPARPDHMEEDSKKMDFDLRVKNLLKFYKGLPYEKGGSFIFKASPTNEHQRSSSFTSEQRLTLNYMVDMVTYWGNPMARCKAYKDLYSALKSNIKASKLGKRSHTSNSGKHTKESKESKDKK